jgi:cytochrome c biogenesis factor
MSVCLAWRLIGRGRALYIVVFIIGASIAFAVIGDATDSVDALVAFSLPSYLAAMASSAVAVCRTKRGAGIRTFLYRLGPNMIHIGVALVLVSFVISTQMQAVPVQGEWSDVAVGGEITVDEFSVRLQSISYYQTEGVVDGHLVTTTVIVVVDVFRSGELERDNVQLRSVYGGPSVLVRADLLEADVFVLTTLTKDLYVSSEWEDEDTASIHVKSVPMMLGLWSGLVIVCVGAVLRTVSWVPRRDASARS